MKLLLTTIHEFDVTMFSWVMGRKNRALFTRIGKWISHTGDGFLYAAYGLYLGLNQGTEEHMLLISALLAFSIERPLYFILKNGFRRNRPQEALNGFRSFIIPSDQFSFPSGHTSGAFLMATLISSFYPSLIIPAYFWALSVGLSRIFLGVHFPTDILVGMTMGTTIALLGLNLAGV
jgi:undecaprenyl-diphosphatase